MLTPAVAGDANKALSMALQSQTGIGKALIPTLAERAIPKPLQPTADIQNYEFAKTTGFKGSFNDFKNQLTPHQQEQLKIDREKLGIDLQKLNLDKAKAEQEIKFGKPLPEAANKQVTGATNLKDAIENYKNNLKGFTTLDMANPDSRANMGNAYNNMMLQAKEAYNLGVLNGPDYQILQSVVKDPTSPSSLLVSKKALEKQANDLSTQADKIIENVYKTHNKQNPNLVNPKVIKDTSQVTPLSFVTEADAAKAGLKKGTRVTINGVTGTWE
jgi:hypothetical protein